MMPGSATDGEAGTIIVQSANTVPSVDSVVLNSGSPIVLSGYPTTSISAVGTTTDTDGYTDISSITGKLYRSGVTSTFNCATDTDNCYEDISCATSSCSTTTDSCQFSCDFNVQFYAEPTNEGTYIDEDWVAWVKVIDSASASSTATSPGVELNALQSLDISTSTIDYGY